MYTSCFAINQFLQNFFSLRCSYLLKNKTAVGSLNMGSWGFSDFGIPSASLSPMETKCSLQISVILLCSVNSQSLYKILFVLLEFVPCPLACFRTFHVPFFHPYFHHVFVCNTLFSVLRVFYLLCFLHG